MLTGELRSQIDTLWNSFWTGGISNPMEVMEQITYLMFLRRLDDLHTLEENKSLRLGKPMERRNFYDLRWSNFKNFAPAAKDLLVIVKTQRTELLFYALFCACLKLVAGPQASCLTA